MQSCSVRTSGLGTSIQRDGSILVDTSSDTLTDGTGDVPQTCTDDYARCNDESTLDACSANKRTITFCPRGPCVDDGAGPHCVSISPSNHNLSTADIAATSAQLTFTRHDNSSTFVIDTDTGAILNGLPNNDWTPDVIRQAGEGLIDGVHFTKIATNVGVTTGYGVFLLNSLTLSADTTLIFTGDYTPIVIAYTMDIAGDIRPRWRFVDFKMLGEQRVARVVTSAGGWPGGTPNDNGQSGRDGSGAGGGKVGSEDSNDDGGGGGGSFSSHGGSGGKGGGGSADGGQPGMTHGSETLVPLTSGSGGAAGADDDGAYGGYGGGAMQLVALHRFTLRSTGMIAAPGGNASIATFARLGEGCSDAGAGGGGGSGGGILIEAGLFSFESGATISVVGGGGSRGYPQDPCSDSADLENLTGAGRRASKQDKYTIVDERTGPGGIGGKAADIFGSAADGGDHSVHGGGGGGGAGRIRINALDPPDESSISFVPDLSNVLSTGTVSTN